MSSYPRIPAYNAFLKEEEVCLHSKSFVILKIFYRI